MILKRSRIQSAGSVSQVDSSRCSAGLGENDLPHVDIARQKTGFAVSEIVLPKPPETLVEPERGQVRPGGAKVIPPGGERSGIILSENALPDNGDTEFVAERFQHGGRGQHAAREDVALDE